MLKEDKEVLKTCAILVLSSIVITGMVYMTSVRSENNVLRLENTELSKEVYICQGGTTHDEQVQNNCE